MMMHHFPRAISQYRFEKDQVAASLLLSDGTTRKGCFFVVASTTHHGPERVRDLLNDTGRFFPFQRSDGRTGQYNRSHVVMVHLPAGLAEEQLEPDYSIALRQEVTMTLSTGATVEGTLLVSGPAGHDRLSDYVRHEKHFWYVVTAHGTAIVNSNHIVELVERSAQ